MIPLRTGVVPPYDVPPPMPRATHYGDEFDMQEPCPACQGPSVWSYTRREGEHRVPLLVIDCPGCDLAVA